MTETTPAPLSAAERKSARDMARNTGVADINDVIEAIADEALAKLVQTEATLDEARTALADAERERDAVRDELREVRNRWDACDMELVVARSDLAAARRDVQELSEALNSGLAIDPYGDDWDIRLDQWRIATSMLLTRLRSRLLASIRSDQPSAAPEGEEDAVSQ